MTGHAPANRAAWPGPASKLDAVESIKPAFDSEREAREPGRGSSMVARDHPHPAPRPSPDMATDADRDAFSAAWEKEQSEAAARHARAIRKAAFKAMRRADPAPTRARIFARAARQ